MGGATLAGLAILAIFAPHAAGPLDRYETALIGLEDIEETIIATGKVRPRAFVDVGAQVSGQLERLHVKVGDLVREGDLLAEIDADAQTAKVEGIRAERARLVAELAELQASLTFAERQHTRQAELSRSNAVSLAKEDESRRDMDVAKARIDATNARIRQTEASLRAEDVVLSYARIVAPMTGTVVSVDAQEGQTLNANYEAPLILRIADLATMKVWAEVSEGDVTKLSQGMPVRFSTLGHRERVWTATLGQIMPVPHRPNPKSTGGETSSAKSNVVTYMALFDVENADQQLRAEMTAQVTFIHARSERAVAIPVAAFRNEEDSKQSVLQADATSGQIRLMNAQGEITVRDVSLGLRNRSFVEAKSGVAAGERVIISEKANPPRSSLRIER